MIRTNPDFFRDEKISDTAKGVGAFVAEHEDGAPLGAIINFFRHDTPLRIAYALDELEAAGYLTRTVPAHLEEPDVWVVIYSATSALREVAA